MKGIWLALFGVVIGAVSLYGAGNDTEFGIGTDRSAATDLASMLRAPIKAASNGSAGQFVSYDRSEVRGGKPSVAYTVFHFDSKGANVSLQPVFGRINGAQIFLSF